jgi:hypothetical protein
MIRAAILSLAPAIVVCSIGQHALAQTFVDWTSIDTTGGVATGTLDGSTVTMTGMCGLAGMFPCTLVFGVTDESASQFADATLFSTPIASSDLVGFVGAPGNGAPYPYTVTFSTSVADPVILIENTASRMVFTIPGGTTLERLSGDPTIDGRTFTVTGTTVEGTLHDCSQPCRVDAAGEIRNNGVVSSFSYPALYDNPSTVFDGLS